MRATALVLDLSHRALLVDGALVAVDVPGAMRPLAALQEHGRVLGLQLAMPLGHRADPDHAQFVFIEPAIAAADGRELVPLREWATDAALAPAWSFYVDAMLGGWKPPTRELDVFSFGDTPLMAAQLAHHIIKGKKRGTTGRVATTEHVGATIPVPGMISIVTDGFGLPLCAIETTRIDRGPFSSAGEEIAAAEAEGDLSLAGWQVSHRRYYENEAARLGFTFNDDVEMFYEYFRVVRVLGN